MPQCPHGGFRPMYPPAGGVCPWCGRQMCVPGCLQMIVWIIVIIAVLVAFGA